MHNSQNVKTKTEHQKYSHYKKKKKTLCEVMDVLSNHMVVIFSHIRVSDHHIMLCLLQFSEAKGGTDKKMLPTFYWLKYTK